MQFKLFLLAYTLGKTSQKVTTKGTTITSKINLKQAMWLDKGLHNKENKITTQYW
jgi:hypothetical protein